MKKLFTAPLLLIAVLVATWTIQTPKAFAAGGDNVFPLDFPLPFPWENIEGTWRVEDEEFVAYFSFEIQTDCDRHQVLRVMQLDAENKKVMAEGIGSRMATSQQVYAAMKGDGGTYMLYLGAYRTKGLFPQNVTGLRIYSFTQASSERRYRIYKVGEQPFRSGMGQSNGSVISGSDCR